MIPRGNARMGRDCTWDVCELEGDGDGQQPDFNASDVGRLNRLRGADDEA